MKSNNDIIFLSSEDIRHHKGVSFVGVATCFFCHDGKGKFVMAKRSINARDEQGNWDIGGGGLKWGVTAEDNVRREVKEEYGVAAQQIEFLGYRDVFRTLPDGTNTHWLALDFAVMVNHSKVSIHEQDMFSDINWFTLHTIPTPLHTQLPKFFELYNEKLRQILT